MKKPILVSTLGFPGSGKTYFSENLAKNEIYFHINSDMTRFTVYKRPTFSKKETQGVFRLMDQMTESLLKMGISVVYDANMNYRIHRKRLQNLAKKSGAKYCLVWIKTEVSIAEKRLEKRASIKDKNKKLLYRPIKSEILHMFKGEIEEPTRSEPFVIIDGHVFYSEQIKTFKKYIRTL